jgi:hypothetical protein
MASEQAELTPRTCAGPLDRFLGYIVVGLTNREQNCTALAALFTWMATWDEVPGHGLALISLAAVDGIVANTGTVRASTLCGGLAAAAAAPLPIWMDIQGPAFGF